jgi:hypothetical protein
MNIASTDTILKRFVNQQGKELAKTLTDEITRNNWIRTGTLLNSVQASIQTFKDRVLLDINIADYYTFLKTGKKRTSSVSSASAKRVSARSGRVGANTMANSAPIKNVETQKNFVADIIKKKLPIYEKNLAALVEKDIQKKINSEMKNIKITV